MQEEGSGGRREMLKIYAAAVVSIAVLALLSFLLVPSGTSLQSCRSLVVQGSRYTCITELALSQANVSLCSYENGSYADSCYSQVAMASNNTAECDGIKSPEVFGACVAYTASARDNYTACTQAAQPYSDRCIANIAVKLDNSTICGMMSNATFGSECSSIIAIRGAFSTKNATLCSAASSSSDSSVVDYIISNVSGSTTGSSLQTGSAISAAIFLPNSTYTARDYCYTTLATSTGNTALCLNVSAGEAKTLCTEEAGAVSSNSTANFTQILASCSSAGAYAQQCTSAVILAQAVSTQNATLCTELAQNQEYNCYSLLASTYSNSAYCSGIGNSTEMQACITGS